MLVETLALGEAEILHQVDLQNFCYTISGLMLGLRPANERRRYKVKTSLIGWARTYLALNMLVAMSA